jgi:putative GTP pyrophosphokinase
MKELLSKDDFLQKYNKTTKEFHKTGLDWKMLESIYYNYQEEMPHLEALAVFIFNSLMKTQNVHSVRYRIKDPEHLIEKIIRKKIKNPELDINLENYLNCLTDLIGLRALHLFKEDWDPIHHFITKTWNLLGNGVINYRKGDVLRADEILLELGLEKKERDAAYRSIHYIIETKPAKNIYYAEIQVRTIFEEAWSEIDHTIRYPYDQDNPLFNQFLMIFNRLAGSADEMGTYISSLKNHIKDTEASHAAALLDKDFAFKELEDKVKKLGNSKESESINETIEKLRRSQFEASITFSDFLKSKTFANEGLQNIGRLLSANYPTTFAYKLSDSVTNAIQAANQLKSFEALYVPNREIEKGKSRKSKIKKSDQNEDTKD